MLLDAIRKIWDKIDSICLSIANIALFAAMLVVTADAGGRYLFSSPIIGDYDFTTFYLAPVIIYFILSYSYVTNAHIRIEFVFERLPKRLQRACRIVTEAIILILSMIFFVEGIERAWKSWVLKDVYQGAITWPLYWAYALVPIGFLFLAIRVAQQLVALIGAKGE
ncbi:MAG: hypothetical protein PWP65_615 [Clostridia bacterium]|nr:hypothetical protein [Clostridia bacterium]